MFQVNDRIYIKKYIGNDLATDYKRNYLIVEINNAKTKKGNIIYFEKYAILENGREQLLYSYNTIIKEQLFYVEKVPWYYYLLCGYIF
tara:strand:- start:61 stop:324 length:264 start_codon:yes stop_codon:yes gene_type:complete